MVLPFFTPAAIPGLFIGSLISNFVMSPFMAVGGSYESSVVIKIMYAVLIESTAALVSSFISYFIGKRQKFAVPIPPIIINALTIPFIYTYSVVKETVPRFGIRYSKESSALRCWTRSLP